MEEKLLEIAKEVLDKDNITLDTEKKDCVEWDSAAHLILLAELEENMNLNIPIEETEHIERLRDFLTFAK